MDEVLVMKVQFKKNAANCHDVNSMLAMYTGCTAHPDALTHPKEIQNLCECHLRIFLAGENAKELKEKLINLTSPLV
jgi:hypothetical protein